MLTASSFSRSKSSTTSGESTSSMSRSSSMVLEIQFSPMLIQRNKLKIQRTCQMSTVNTWLTSHQQHMYLLLLFFPFEFSWHLKCTFFELMLLQHLPWSEPYIIYKHPKHQSERSFAFRPEEVQNFNPNCLIFTLSPTKKVSCDAWHQFIIYLQAWEYGPLISSFKKCFYFHLLRRVTTKAIYLNLMKTKVEVSQLLKKKKLKKLKTRF